MKRGTLIGLSGRAGAGKDEFLRALTGGVYLGTHWFAAPTAERFAGPLKGMLRHLLKCAGVHPAIIERYIEGDLKETPCPELGGKTPRQAMQTLGTEWGRKLISPTIWVDTTRRHLQRSLAVGRNVAVSDVRFDNEVEVIRDLGGVVVRIVRPEADARACEHESEVLPAYDHVIVNDGTIPEYHQKVRALIVALAQRAV